MQNLTGREWVDLVARVFGKQPDDRNMAIVVDLPDAELADHPLWSQRRAIAREWHRTLGSVRDELGFFAIDLIYFRNARRNNADFPERAHVHGGGDHPESAEDVAYDRSFAELFASYSVWLAPTECSATAPLKVAAREHRFRAATMPGFVPAMIPALKLDYVDVDRRCRELKSRLDRADRAELRLQAAGESFELTLDLRHRTGTASGGRLVEPGVAGNLPSGETYIVPYEGERAGDPSRSAGRLPLEWDGELIVWVVEGNRIVDVEGEGPRAERERSEIRKEPAYANLAELGLGILADYGIEPIGELLLDEKLGLHIAQGRSDHFGGSVGPAQFSSPERVIHLDHVYIPQVQPGVRVSAVDLVAGETVDPLIVDGRYV